MESIKNWLFTQGFLLLNFTALIVAAVITYYLWIGLEKLERSNLGFVVRVLICIPAVIAGWMLIGGIVALWSWDVPVIASIFKTLFEGPWISIVFFKAIPNKGKFAAIPLVALHCALQAYIAYLGLFEEEPARFSSTEGAFALLGIMTSIGTYYFLYRQQSKVTTS